MLYFQPLVAVLLLYGREEKAVTASQEALRSRLGL